MRAAIFRNGEIVVDTLPEPRPGRGQVLVKTLACGICGSDLHAQACPSLQALLPALKPALIFECVGIPGLLQQVFEGAPRDARIVVVGVCMETDRSAS